ncbi:MAG: hypothetical protein Q9180_005905, partial [Flavoplaca navasiana]
TSHYILQLPREALTEDELATLSKIYLRFNPAPVNLPETIDPREGQDTTQTRKDTSETVATETTIISEDDEEEVTLGKNEGPTMLVPTKRSQSAADNDQHPTPKKRGRPSKGVATKAPTQQSQSWGTILTMTELSLQIEVEQHLLDNAEGKAENFLAKLSALPPPRTISCKKELQTFHDEVDKMRLSSISDGLGKLFLILRFWEVCGLVTDKWPKQADSTVDEKEEFITKDFTLATQGKNLQFICQIYGIGSIFWLYSHFTSNL